MLLPPCAGRLAWLLLLAAPAAAQVRPAAPAVYEATIVGNPTPDELPDERAVSTVQKSELDRRLPRSAPDALRYEPGVFVQQTAHAQGSAFIRGLTGQQTVLLFDGIRLNNATYRQGPNQYFFTIDSRSVDSISVLRGGASTRFGSDALGGVIDAQPIAPQLPLSGFVFRPRALARVATADDEVGGRGQIEVAGALPSGLALGFVGGVGYRSVGLLESGGPVINPDPGYRDRISPLPDVPRFAGYDPTRPVEGQGLRVQLGTGFRELTADGRLVLEPSPGQKLTVAGYLYRQYDAPRTDQCPPPTAPVGNCLVYEEQFRHLVYGAWDGRFGAWARELRLTLSWQHQHERRRRDQPSNLHRTDLGNDDVHTAGLAFRVTTAWLRPRPWIALRGHYGLDTYFDFVRSRAEHSFPDSPPTPESRGQYLDGSYYLSGGAFLDLEADFRGGVTIRGGGRVGWVAAHAPGDPESGSRAVDRAWAPVVGHLGAEWRVTPPIALLVNVDHSYRAPNLDDMTSRQQTGPGFQFENAALQPEKATTFELGGRLRHRWLVADLWLFETLLQDKMLKVTKTAAECPPATEQCNASWSRLQLQNAPALSELRGVEGGARANLPAGFSLRATVGYVWGEDPRVGELPQRTFGVVVGERVPASRMPPLFGTAELAWQPRFGVHFGAALRWAAAQDRLALADYADGRIPKYGTPAFAVLDLRASYRFRDHVVLSAVFENVFDSPYRYHGSSVNGPGRGVLVLAEVAPL